MRFGSDQLEVEVLPELGARLHRLRAFGNDLLRTPDDLDAYRVEPFFWGSFVMAPWCNRVAAGPQRVGEAVVNVPANFSDGTAIHGQVQALPWESGEPGLLHVTAGGDGWPWRYEVTQRFEVDGPRLRLALQLTNLSVEPMPAGIGIHPWLRRPLEVAVHADRVLVSNEASTAEPEPVSGDHDLRRMRPMPLGLDATWERMPGPVIATLHWPQLGIGATMYASPEVAYLCAASPGSSAAVAIEPQTHAPNGLRRVANGEPGALLLLAPGSNLRLVVELEFRRAAEG